MKHIYSRWLKNPKGKFAYLGIYRPCSVDWFAERDKNLLELGYPSYKTYIESSLWKTIRKNVKDKHHICCFCGGKGAVVHHRVYCKKTLLGQKYRHLVMLCLLCHELVHTNEDGTPANWWTVHFRFWIRQREYELLKKYNTVIANKTTANLLIEDHANPINCQR